MTTNNYSLRNAFASVARASLFQATFSFWCLTAACTEAVKVSVGDISMSLEYVSKLNAITVCPIEVPFSFHVASEKLHAFVVQKTQTHGQYLRAVTLRVAAYK